MVAPTPEKLAVLIDADNVPAAIVATLMEEDRNLDCAVVKRIYGDFSSPLVFGPWKDVLLRYAIHPVQQFAYTVRKNATDMALVIDAMDLLHSGRYDGFCIVSSDSDFTPLAMRIHEAGRYVFGYGEQKTPAAFRNACNQFVLTGMPGRRREADPEREGASALVSGGACRSVTHGGGSWTGPFKPFPLELVRRTIEKARDPSGWAFLGAVGVNLQASCPDFDPRSYGCSSSKLGTFVRQFPEHIETQERKTDSCEGVRLYVRMRI